LQLGNLIYSALGFTYLNVIPYPKGPSLLIEGLMRSYFLLKHLISHDWESCEFCLVGLETKQVECLDGVLWKKWKLFGHFMTVY